MDGVICVLKPPGMTSSNVVADVRRVLGVKKAGHMGTLDPGAAGVMVVGVGKATRLFDVLAQDNKEYIAEIAFGLSTDTQDAYGSVVEYGQCWVEEDAFKSAAAKLTGRMMQVPSSYSAIKIDGKKAYQLARGGCPADLSARAREIEIYSIELMEFMQTSALVRIKCSKGTYIRQLAEQFGVELGTRAYLAFLLRTESGGYTIDSAVTIAELTRLAERGDFSFIRPIDEALTGYPAIKTPDECRRALMNGNSIPVQGYSQGEYRVYCMDEFYGIGEIWQGMLVIKLMLYRGGFE